MLSKLMEMLLQKLELRIIKFGFIEFYLQQKEVALNKLKINF